MADPARPSSCSTRSRELGVRLVDRRLRHRLFVARATSSELPVDELKIDRSFVTEHGPGASDAIIVRSTIELGHNLGLTVVAEGVETQRPGTGVRALGCDIAQGYVYGRRHRSRSWPGWRSTAGAAAA